MIEDGEERLASLSILPVSFSRRFVPYLTGLDLVVVLFAVVRAVLTGFAKDLRIHLQR